MSKKAYKGIGMNGVIAKWYSKLVKKDYDDYKELAERIKRDQKGKKDILEVAPGPGYLSIELAKKTNFNIAGLDISETFVQIASENAKNDNVKVNFIVGNASEMPFSEDKFGFIVCRAAFKNFSEPLKAINEMYRVLRPAGKALIIDMRNDVSDQEIDTFVEMMNLGKKDKFITSWTFKSMLRKRAYSIAEIEQLCRNSRFKDYQIDITPTGFELWLKK